MLQQQFVARIVDNVVSEKLDRFILDDITGDAGIALGTALAATRVSGAEVRVSMFMCFNVYGVLMSIVSTQRLYGACRHSTPNSLTATIQHH
jgi:hypothetical protein